MPSYRAVSDHPESGTRRGEVYEAEPTDVRVAAGLLVPVPEAEPPKAKRRKAKKAD